MHFGSALRLLRIDAGLSLRALARAIGVSSAYLSRVENGLDAVPTPDRLVEIARALGISSGLLIDLARKVDPFVSRYLESVPAANALFLEIARRNLSGAQLARVMAFIEAEFPGSLAQSGSSLVRLSSLLTPERIILRLGCSDLEDAIDVAAARLAVPGSPWTSSRIAREICQREEEASTALGHGVAVPHAVLPGSPTLAALVTLARPLSVPTPDGLPLRLLIVLLSGTGGRPHLELLAQVAKLANSLTGDQLVGAETPQQLLELLTCLDVGLG